METLQIQYKYYVAEDSVCFVRGKTEDEAYENFNKQYGYYPDRVLGIISEKDGGLNGEVVWEKDEDNE